MKLNNEQGAALLYVLMISMLFVLIVPSVLFFGSNSELQNMRSEKEKIVNQLAVSGMQAIARYPGTIQDKLTFLSNNYDERSFTLPDGMVVGYRQYAVNVDDDPEVSNRVDGTLLDMNTNYKIVVHAYIGSIEKILVSYMDLTGPSITISPDQQTEGKVVPVTVIVQTHNAIGETRSIVIEGPNSHSSDCIVDSSGICTVTFNNLSDLHPVTYNVQITDSDDVPIIYTDPKFFTVIPAPILIGPVTATPISHITGSEQIVDVSVTTSGAPNNGYERPIIVELVDESDFSSLSSPVINEDSFTGNSKDVGLTIPASVSAGNYRIKITIPGAIPHTDTEYDIISPSSVNSIITNPTMHGVGQTMLISVTISTSGYSDDTPVLIEFINNTTLESQANNGGTITDNIASIPLFIDTTATVGMYRIKATILGVAYYSAIDYEISEQPPEANPEGDALTYNDGELVRITESELSAGMSIDTDGILFIPESYEIGRAHV